MKRKLRKPPVTLRRFDLNEEIGSLVLLAGELQDMTDVLLGRVPPPVNPRQVEALMEVADAYFARASEITMHIQEAERLGKVVKGSPYYKFRTGELRTFIEIARSASQLGSRRITVAQLNADQERYGREGI